MRPPLTAALNMVLAYAETWGPDGFPAPSDDQVRYVFVNVDRRWDPISKNSQGRNNCSISPRMRESGYQTYTSESPCPARYTSVTENSKNGKNANPILFPSGAMLVEERSNELLLALVV